MEHILKGGRTFLSDFRDFAVRGNVVDLAVGVIIGGAFQPIVNSLVGDIIMPPLGRLIGNVDFKDLMVVIKAGKDGKEHYDTLAEAKAQAAITVNYGNFINVTINFIIVAFAVFLLVKGIQKMKRKAAEVPPPPAPPSQQEVLLTEIRDLLKARKI